MIKRFLALAVMAGALGLAACESGPTPYQPGGEGDRGYSERQIEDTRYRISFKGNSLTDRDTVETYMLFRAAELTLQHGYDTFTIVNRDTDKDSDVRRSGGYMGMRMSYYYFVPRSGWIAAWEPYWTPTSYREVTRFEAFAEVVMARGPKGNDPNTFDARQVSQNLASQVTRPTP